MSGKPKKKKWRPNRTDLMGSYRLRQQPCLDQPTQWLRLCSRISTSSPWLTLTGKPASTTNEPCQSSLSFSFFCFCFVWLPGIRTDERKKKKNSAFQSHIYGEGTTKRIYYYYYYYFLFLVWIDCDSITLIFSGFFFFLIIFFVRVYTWKSLIGGTTQIELV